VAFEALDNGIKSCADPGWRNGCATAVAEKSIDCCASGCDACRIRFRRATAPPAIATSSSILQAEFSLTQVLDQPVTGRVFFEQVIRENLDIGRPTRSAWCSTARSPAAPRRFRTRVITDGVVPSLHVDYKKSRIKQYHKEGQALRTETTINDTRDFAIGRRIENLENCARSALPPTDVCSTSNASATTASSAKHPSRTCKTRHHRQPARRGTSLRRPARSALCHVMLLFLLVHGTFTHKDVREHLAPLLGHRPSQYTAGRITYDLRRLRLHGSSNASPKPPYRITTKGCAPPSSTHGSITARCKQGWPSSPRNASIQISLWQKSIRAAETALDKWYQHAKIAA